MASVATRPRTWPPPVCKLGRRGLCALVAGGGYAQRCTAPIPQCLPVPAGFTDIEAASLPETFFTVWSNVWDRGRLQAGETLLVQGGSSGIGVTAIQLGKAMGSKVIVTAGSDDKVAACMALGADVGINYKTQDFVAEVKAATGGQGANVVLDMVAGDYLARELQCMADDGRLVIIAVQGGTQLRPSMPAWCCASAVSPLPAAPCARGPVAFKRCASRSNVRASKSWPLLEARPARSSRSSTQVFPAAKAAEVPRA
jgi:NADPH2:quinone reductase